MKTALLILVLMALSQMGLAIGHPHNLFAARKAMLTRQAELRRAKSVPLPLRVNRTAKHYSYTFVPRFSQITHVRE